ncbi:N-6 DNA methylase [Bacteroidales bacterium OttesenSCG-928-C03]|nr:N-6 DNA methylase [Bacteroidales bacterium OttesenSCG-928-C03]
METSSMLIDRVLNFDQGLRQYARSLTMNHEDASDLVQDMIKSMTTTNGRVAVVLPHGALFRKGAEAKIRAALLEMDLLDAVIGLGSNIFYGATLAACILIFRAKKKPSKVKKVLFIDAADQVRTGRAQNFLDATHIDTIFKWYSDWKDVKDYAAVVSLEDIKKNDYNLNIPLYVEKEIVDDLPSLEEAMVDLKTAVAASKAAEERLKELLKNYL